MEDLIISHPLLEVVFRLPRSLHTFHSDFHSLMRPRRWRREVRSMLDCINDMESLNLGRYYDRICSFAYDPDHVRLLGRCRRIRIEVLVIDDGRDISSSPAGHLGARIQTPEVEEEDDGLAVLIQMRLLHGGGNGGDQDHLHAATADDEVDQVMELSLHDSNAQGGFGAVPASATSIMNLKVLTMNGGGSSDGAVEEEKSTCTVCLEDMEQGQEICEMPCWHVFHVDCLRPWLQLSRLCPLCRHALIGEDDN